MVLLALPLFIIIFSNFSYAREEVYNGQLVSGESIELDDHIFIVTMNKYANRIFVNAGSMYQSVPVTTCESMEWFNICFDNATFDYDENELYINMRVYRYQPDLTLTREFNQTEVSIGQSIEVTLSLVNAGDTATDIILTDDYPPSVEIYDMEGGCNFHENQVYWKGHLNANKTKECTFYVKGTEPLEQSLVAKLKYYDGYRWIEEFSSADTLLIEGPTVEIESMFLREDEEIDASTLDFDSDNNDNWVVGETGQFIVNLSVDFTEDIKIHKFEVIIPDSLDYISQGYVRFNFENASGNRSSEVWSSERITEVSNNNLVYSKTVDANSTSKLFVMKMLAKKSGVQQLIMNIDYETEEGERFTKMFQKKLSVVDPGVRIDMTVSDLSDRFVGVEILDEDDTEVDLEALHEYRFSVYVQNMNHYSELSDVEVNIYSDLADFDTINYDFIDESGSRIPYGLTVVPQYIPEDTTYKMNVSVSYKNEFGDVAQNSTEYTANVKSFKDIGVNVNSEEGLALVSKEETLITVTLENERIVDIRGVKVSDSFSEGLEVQGVHSNKLKLLADEDTIVYKYRLTMPIVREITVFNIVTTISYFDEDQQKEFSYNYTTDLTVSPLEPDMSIDVTFNEPEDIYVGSIIPADFVISNQETEELIRNISLVYPLSDEYDIIGDLSKSFSVLEPSESVTFSDLIRIRPKVVSESLEFDECSVFFTDNYGVSFVENSTSKTFDVKDGLVSGPRFFARTVVPKINNISTPIQIEIEVINNGSSSDWVNVIQGDQSWNLTVSAGSKESIFYDLIYSDEVNVTLEDPILEWNYFSTNAYTLGKGESFKVIELNETVESYLESVEKAEKVAAAPVVHEEKVEMSFEEYFKLRDDALKKNVYLYGSIFLLIAVIAVIAFVIFYYTIGKKPSNPFQEKSDSNDENKFLDNN